MRGPDRRDGSSRSRSSASCVARKNPSAIPVARYSGSCRSPDRTAPPEHGHAPRHPPDAGPPPRRSDPARAPARPSSRTRPAPRRSAHRSVHPPVPRRSPPTCTCARTPASRPLRPPGADRPSEPPPVPAPWPSAPRLAGEVVGCRRRRPGAASEKLDHHRGFSVAVRAPSSRSIATRCARTSTALPHPPCRCSPSERSDSGSPRSAPPRGSAPVPPLAPSPSRSRPRHRLAQQFRRRHARRLGLGRHAANSSAETRARTVAVRFLAGRLMLGVKGGQPPASPNVAH